MSDNNNKYFPSKLILFGEYTVIKGSNVIAIPLDKYKGNFDYDNLFPNENLLTFGEFLNNIEWREYGVIFNFDQYLLDLKRGLYFNSNIKLGYGSGSSGALSAAIFASYFVYNSLDLREVNMILSKIESYFHGSSSGIDPMVSYYNSTILYSKEKGFEVINKNRINFSKYNFYILDSNKKRSTKEYVEIFNKKCEEKEFTNKYLKPLTEFNNLIIEKYLADDEERVFEIFNNISQIQYDSFREMIVPDLEGIWKLFLSSNDISIKLCGAGGGGYYLIMSKSNVDISHYQDKFEIIRLK